MTVGERLAQVRAQLKDRGIETYSLDARLLMMAAMDFDQMRLVTHDRDEVTQAAEKRLGELVSQRLDFKPMQYILGRCEFMGLDFAVNENTLIPRPDTEILVEQAIDVIQKNGCKAVLDLCTGSGAIAVSIAKYCPQVRVTGTDISPMALEAARQNAEQNGVCVEFLQSNIFEAVKGRFDIIVSNPPYIEASVVDTLDRQVRDYEPRLALDGGEDGLYFYKAIISQAKEYLKDCRGALLFEIGYNQAEAVKRLFEEHNYKNIAIKNDLSGLNRVAIAYNMW